MTKTAIVMGGGLTGLAAGYALTKAGISVRLFENDSEVGGLSKTIEKDGFRFDLGGHRFFTRNARIDGFVRELMGDELIEVQRKSKIYLRGRYFNYPLRPLNAIFGLGAPTTFRILGDYGLEKARRMVKTRQDVSLEDWVVGNFGRTMFDIYFREYSEKVWGISCGQISASWVARRIDGLSLAKAVENAFFKFTGRNIPTLADRFVYPRLGIGRLSEKLSEGIRWKRGLHTGTRVVGINHSGPQIGSVEVRDGNSAAVVPGEEFISSIPLPNLVSMLRPAPPARILETAARLRFRDLVIVAVMLDRERVTDQTWIYIPEKKIPFGRIHEPTNWSADMAPPGKTLLVAEYFSFRGDSIWDECDEGLIGTTVSNLERLGFVRRREVLGGVVVRAPKAYPLFEVGYDALCRDICDYLDRFTNLHIAGRVGMFRYYNMDHAIESGLESAGRVIGRDGARDGSLEPSAASFEEVNV